MRRGWSMRAPLSTCPLRLEELWMTGTKRSASITNTLCAEGGLQLMNPQVFPPLSRCGTLGYLLPCRGRGLLANVFASPLSILLDIPSNPISGSSFSLREELVTGVCERWRQSTGGCRNPLWSNRDPWTGSHRRYMEK